uniref:VSG n=1 Tax=Trypanosoma evansi TaxID=5697 RepID=G1CRQ6_TRYEV|nr:VSG [Trypanosoma evansi]
MKKPRFCLAALVMVVSLVERTAPAQKSSKEFRDLCELFKLLSKPMPTVSVNDQPPDKPENSVPLGQAMDAIIGRIKKLNLTVLEPDNEEVLKDKTKYNEFSKIKDAKKDGYFETGDIKEVEEMRAVYEDLTKEDDNGKGFNSKFELPLPEYKREPRGQYFANTWTERCNKKKGRKREKAGNYGGRSGIKCQKSGRKATIKALYGESYAANSQRQNNLRQQNPRQFFFGIFFVPS